MEGPDKSPGTTKEIKGSGLYVDGSYMGQMVGCADSKLVSCFGGLGPFYEYIITGYIIKFKNTKEKEN